MLRFVTAAACAQLVASEWPDRPINPHRAPALSAHSFGAVPDNSTDNRAAITKALAACAAARGCTLTFPGPGIYVTSPIALVTNLTLVIAEGATLHGARSRAGWPILPYPEWPSRPNGNSPPGVRAPSPPPASPASHPHCLPHRDRRAGSSGRTWSPTAPTSAGSAATTSAT